MKVKMRRQAFPSGGGTVFAAGRIYDLPAQVVKTLPKGSYERIRAREKDKTPTPRD
jgi:hypothetical protein